MTDIDDFLLSENRYSFSDDDTYAVKDLKKAMNEKKFGKYVELCSDNRFNVWYLTKYMRGVTQKIGNIYVYYMREAIQPAKWYTKVAEKLSKPVEFKSKGYPAEALRTRDSCGHILLRKLKNDRGSYEAAASFYNVDIVIMQNVMLYAKKDGEKQHKSLPTDSFIRTFRKFINPDYWFIFPEELVNEKDKILFNRLMEKL